MMPDSIRRMCRYLHLEVDQGSQMVTDAVDITPERTSAFQKSRSGANQRTSETDSLTAESPENKSTGVSPSSSFNAGSQQFKDRKSVFGNPQSVLKGLSPPSPLPRRPSASKQQERPDQQENHTFLGASLGESAASIIRFFKKKKMKSSDALLPPVSSDSPKLTIPTSPDDISPSIPSWSSPNISTPSETLAEATFETSMGSALIMTANRSTADSAEPTPTAIQLTVTDVPPEQPERLTPEELVINLEERDQKESGASGRPSESTRHSPTSPTRSTGTLTTAERVVGSFLFLRFLVPAITSPDAYGLLEKKISSKARRGLILCGKVVTALCNDVEFGNKEAYLTSLNPFLKERRFQIKQYLTFASASDLSRDCSFPTDESPRRETLMNGSTPDISAPSSRPLSICINGAKNANSSASPAVSSVTSETSKTIGSSPGSVPGTPSPPGRSSRSSSPKKRSIIGHRRNQVEDENSPKQRQRRSPSRSPHRRTLFNDHALSQSMPSLTEWPNPNGTSSPRSGDVTPRRVRVKRGSLGHGGSEAYGGNLNNGSISSSAENGLNVSLAKSKRRMGRSRSHEALNRRSQKQGSTTLSANRRLSVDTEKFFNFLAKILPKVEKDLEDRINTLSAEQSEGLVGSFYEMKRILKNAGVGGDDRRSVSGGDDSPRGSDPKRAGGPLLAKLGKIFL
ncbi:hypothetical protein BJ742DRAFT_286355 [Cladochytrium replicatum]|nr:hypothetical protein BJ742DRAFT_286355 [Cladochytrium replicatum]